MKLSTALLAAVALAVPFVSRAVDIATLKPQGYVSDFAGVVDPVSKGELEAYGARRAGHRCSVCVRHYRHTGRRRIEDFTNDLYRLGVSVRKARMKASCCYWWFAIGEAGSRSAEDWKNISRMASRDFCFATWRLTSARISMAKPSCLRHITGGTCSQGKKRPGTSGNAAPEGPASATVRRRFHGRSCWAAFCFFFC